MSFSLVYNFDSLPHALPPLLTRPQRLCLFCPYSPSSAPKPCLYFHCILVRAFIVLWKRCFFFFADCVTVASSSRLLDHSKKDHCYCSLSFSFAPPVLFCSSPASDRVVRLSFFRPCRSQTSLKPLRGPLASKPRNTPCVCVNSTPFFFVRRRKSTIDLLCSSLPLFSRRRRRPDRKHKGIYRMS